MLKAERLLLILLLALLSVFYYQRTIKAFPSFTHAWTQAGYYALALGFVDNHFNFFLPNTPNLEQQFPGKKALTEKEGITSVDFPIHPFIVSVMMAITGKESPGLFRLYTLLWGLAGMFFLFLLVQRLTGSSLKSFTVVLFAFTSPVYVYYQSGFIPSIPSFSAVIIGLYFFLGFRSPYEEKKIFIGILFLMLAALTRTPFAIFLLAASGISLFRWIKNRKADRKEVLGFGIAFSCIGIYFLYNRHLAREYGTMFLGQLMTPGSWEELSAIISVTLENWQYHYLTQWHYIAFLSYSLTGAYFLFRNRSIPPQIKTLITYLALVLPAVVIYFLLMAQQYTDHDYYFIDSFFIPTLLLLIIIISLIPIGSKRPKMIFIAASLFFSVAFVIHCKAVQEERYTLQAWDRGQIVRNEFSGAAQFVDSLKIPAEAKVLVLETYDPYSSLILLRRKGYTVTTTTRENLEKVFKNEFNYMAMPTDISITDVIRNYPEMIHRMEKIGDNGKISIYRKADFKNPQTILSFLGINSSTTLQREVLCNDSSQTYLLNDTIEFSVSFKTFAEKVGCKGGEKLYASAEIDFSGEPNNLQATCLVKRKEETLSYSYFALTKKKAGWQTEEQQFRLPENLQPGDEILYYLWNAGKTQIAYRNLEVIIYK